MYATHLDSALRAPSRSWRSIPFATHLDSALCAPSRSWRSPHKETGMMAAVCKPLLPSCLSPCVAWLLHAKKSPSPQLLCLQKQRLSARSGVRTLDTLIKRHFIHYASPCSSSHTIQVFFPSCIFRARTVNSRIVSPVNTRNRISRKMRQPRILPPPLMALRNAFTV